jgi:aryl-alcohol dehydrogenase-like predicted oxidoreductase
MPLKNSFKSKIVLGTAQFSGNYSLFQNNKKKTNIETLIKFCLENKLNKFDSAINYNNLNFYKMINTKKTILNSKFKFNPNKNVIYHIEIIKSYLNDNNILCLNNLFIHNPNIINYTNLNLLKEIIKSLKDLKLIKYFGYSLYYDPKLINFLILNFKPDTVQIPGSLLDQRLISKSYLDFFKTKNIFIQVRSVFLKGVLLINPNDIPNNLMKWKKIFYNIDKWLQINNYLKPNFLLSYILSNDQIDEIVLGFDSIDQLDEILNLDIYDNFKNPPIFTKDDNILNPSKW